MLRARGIQDNVVALHEYLDWGPVDCPLEDRVAWLESHSPSDIGWDWLTESVQKFRSAAAAAVERPLIWIAPRNANELSGLYWYLDQVRPIDAQMLIADFSIRGNWRDEPPLGLGQLSTELLAQVFERVPEPWNTNRFRPGRWSEMVRETALLRVVRSGKLQSAKSDFFDEIIVQRCPSKWTRWYRVVADAMGDAWEANHNPDDALLKWRVMELVRCGILQLDGDLALHGMDQAAKLRRAK